MVQAYVRHNFFERNQGFARSLRFDVFNDDRTWIMQHRSAAGREWWARFQALLDEQVEWPSEYLFKFIVPTSSLEALTAVFGDHPVRVRASSKGNYASVTARMHMTSSEDVLAIYRAAGKVDGVISL